MVGIDGAAVIVDDRGDLAAERLDQGAHLLAHRLDLRQALHPVAGEIDEQDRAGRIEGEPIGQRAVEQHGLEAHRAPRGTAARPSAWDRRRSGGNP